MGFDFDFSNTKAADGAIWFDLVHPVTGAPAKHNGEVVAMAILGPDHPTMIALEAQISDRRLAQLARTGRPKLTTEEIQAESIERAVASIVDWRNFYSGEVPIEHSPAKVAEMVTNFRWLLDFWQEKYNDRGNFLGSAATARKK